MKRISFDKRFVNEAGNDLIPGKIHTIRQNYYFWKQFEGLEVALFTWTGKPYKKGSRQKVFCVKRIVSVQEIILQNNREMCFYDEYMKVLDARKLALNDGFAHYSFLFDWFADYTPSKMAILHFTDFRY